MSKSQGIGQTNSEVILGNSTQIHQFGESPTTPTFCDFITKFISDDPHDMVDFLRNKEQLKNIFMTINQEVIGEYILDHFLHWTNLYAENFPISCKEFFCSNRSLEIISKEFIGFCFSHKICLNANETMRSFHQHNILLDNVVSSEINNFKAKDKVNILGFGLDDGEHEKLLSKHLIENKKAKEVSLFGVDPYANQGKGITYLSENEIASDEHCFDIMIVRWVLHHVEMKYRWKTFSSCLKRCNPGALILAVEHGFLAKASSFEKKINDFFNLTFDIVANIGLRPGYFLNTSNPGDNFFVSYLEPEDFANISKTIPHRVETEFYDIGPSFPNQTICKFNISSGN